MECAPARIRAQGIQYSVLVWLAQRGRLERMSRGIYRIAYFPADRLAQYREAIRIGEHPNESWRPIQHRTKNE
jgi:predicted transcriptional regulator of viral defense system